MLVKHNLSTINEENLLLKFWRSSSLYEKVIDKNIFKFRNNVNNTNEASFGFIFKSGEGANFYFIEVENLGNNPIRFDFKVEGSQGYNHILKPLEKKIIYGKIETTITMRLYPTQNASEWHEFKLRGFALTKDKSDVYLPNINTLPQDKQPLLPPEGNYKEIQAL